MTQTVLSYVFNVLGLASFILSYLVKGKKMGIILVFNFCGNAFMGLSFLMLLMIGKGDAISAVISSFVGAILGIINYCFSVRDKKVPIWLTVIYGVIFIVLNLWFGGLTLLNAVAIVACLCSVMAVAQSSGKGYRLWALGNSGLWGLYDVLLSAYDKLVTHVVLFLLTLVGMLINDKKSKKDTVEEKGVEESVEENK